jgi:integrase
VSAGARPPTVRVRLRRGPTLSSFVEEWWALYAEPNLEPATLRTYRWVWEQHAQPHLGGLRLRDVTPLEIARFRAEREAAGAGVETIRKTFTMLGSVFSCAVEWQLVERNPVRAARKPRASSARTAVIAEPEQVEAMRASLLARGREPALLVLLAYAGLRPGEALALEWRHVREHSLAIQQAVTDGHVKALKNRRPRAVWLLNPLRDDLESLRRPTGPVIARSDGGFWRETDWRNWRRRVFRPAATSAGLTGARPYDLRHSFASLLIAEGRLSIIEIAAQLGHNPTVCLDIYGHVMAERGDGERSSAEALIAAARAAWPVADPKVRQGRAFRPAASDRHARSQRPA